MAGDQGGENNLNLEKLVGEPYREFIEWQRNTLPNEAFKGELAHGELYGALMAAVKGKGREDTISEDELKKTVSNGLETFYQAVDPDMLASVKQIAGDDANALYFGLRQLYNFSHGIEAGSEGDIFGALEFLAKENKLTAQEFLKHAKKNLEKSPERFAQKIFERELLHFQSRTKPAHVLYYVKEQLQKNGYELENPVNFAKSLGSAFAFAFDDAVTGTLFPEAKKDPATEALERLGFKKREDNKGDYQ
ncbi:hypothetical protein D6783_02490 [Candidatus Woesearchaeota archaeon]|nr:MAG: hypothetical protein D6783_02490 [Candidatus Woesearchaeota archaeon]